MAQIIYKQSGMKKLSPTVERIVLDSADKSKNTAISIPSTQRTPQDQARAMANNMYNGVFIRYAWAGQQVEKIFKDNSRTLPKSDIEKLMVAKIEELAIKGQLVSKHCVTDGMFAKLNVFDVSKIMPNPRDFVKELIKYDKVSKIITPFASDYNNTKVSVDIAEPAIHIEINA